MVDLQKILFGLLCEFDDICRKHGIAYYLSGGSNLGALRHEGFIPWDDDADVRMPRKEYEKLEAIIDSELKEDRAFVCRKKYPDYVNPISRYMDLTTTVLARSRMVDGAPHGVFLDIIILDPMPKQEPELTQWKKLHYVYCEMLEYSHIAAARKSDWDVIDIDLYKTYEKRSQDEGRDAVLRELEADLFTYSEEQADNYCMRFGTTWLGITPISWYGEPREAMFEGRSFYIAQKAELCAHANYGPNWKYLPEADSRTGHSVFRMVDLDSGNCEREYLQLVEPVAVKNAFKEYKAARIEYYPLRFNYHMQRHQPIIHFIQKKLDIDINRFGYEAIKADTSLGMEIFKPYLKLQLETTMKQNGFYVPLDEKATNLLIHVLLVQNRVFEAHLILEIKEKSQGSLDNYQGEMKTQIEELIELSKLLDLKLYQEARVIIDKYISIGSSQLLILQGKAIVDLAFAQNVEDYKQIMADLKQMMELYPNDGDLKKYYGDAVKGTGQEKQARHIYEEAVESINNGLLLLELSKMGIKKKAVQVTKLADDELVEDNMEESEFQNEGESSEEADSEKKTDADRSDIEEV